MLRLDNYTYMVLEVLSQFLEFKMKSELELRRHNYTGRLSDSIDFEIKEELGKKTLVCVMEDYGIAINRGYTPEDARKRISYGNILQTRGFSSIGGKSGYILELEGWFERKLGLSDKKAKKAARATLKKHLEKGYISRRSPNGLGFIDYALSFQKTMTDLLEDEQLMAEIIYNEFKMLANDNFKIDKNF